MTPRDAAALASWLAANPGAPARHFLRYWAAIRITEEDA